MKCPHCLVEIHYQPSRQTISATNYGNWFAYITYCPACKKTVIEIEGESVHGTTWKEPRFLVYPRRPARPGCPDSVPKEYGNDYKEACDVLDISPKASAALSRRCLQHILREKAGAKQRDLYDQIDFVLKNCNLPSHIADSIDAVRNIGNFAAHPQKSTASCEIIGVEAGEAEWNLSVLESLFDFYFVQPEKVKAQRDALNKKLAEAGKPPMK